MSRFASSPHDSPGLDRRRGCRRRAVLAAVTLVAGLAPTAVPAALSRGRRRQPLAIVTRGGAVRRFAVELARTPGQLSRGLMFRAAMAPAHGMLFDFGRERPVAMWMRGTRIPLDMLFIDALGRIRGVAADAVPFSEALIRSPGPVRAVLELNAGTARRLGIATGDRVLHGVFGTATR